MFQADVGQKEDFDAVRKKAKNIGVSKVIISKIWFSVFFKKIK